MGTYNSTNITSNCPRCNKESTFFVFLSFGETARMLELKIGDHYPFYENRQPQNGGPILEGDGYSECPKCKLDFNWIVRIEKGLLSQLSPDLIKLPIIADEEIERSVSCTKCNSINTIKKSFYGKYNKNSVECFDCESIEIQAI